MVLRDKPLPDFVVIGAMRAGTSTLHELLAIQPGLCLPDMKETDYFVASKNHGRGPDWYRRQFRRPDLSCGDISPNYAKRDGFPEAAALLHAANPQSRIIYLLRDPVERALSQYRHHRQSGGDLAPDALLASDEGRHIVATSRYDWQLEPWRELFSEEAILLLTFEDLISDPADTLARLGTFLGIEITPPPTIKKANSSDDLSRLPGWWARLRDTPAGLALRSALPRWLSARLKRAAASSTAPRTVPEVPGNIIDGLRETLAPDTTRLRQSTGLSFDKWSI